MLAEERRQKILELLFREGKVSNSDLCRQFGVSDETVRRDLASIEAVYPVRKVHGGAVAVRLPHREAAYELRRLQNPEQKRLVGEAAAKYIADDDIVGLDSGTGAEAIAEAIHGVKNLRIITNALPVAQILTRKLARGDFSGKVFFVGGELNPGTGSATGAMAVDFLRKFTLDKAFVGATAISERGLTVWDENDGLFSGALVSGASRVIAYGESEKFGKDSFYKVCGLEEVSVLISDGKNPPPAALSRALSGAGVRLETVQTNEP